MKALVLEAPGEEPVLTVLDVPDPRVGPGEVLVRIAACGLCHHDISIMRGLLRRGVKPGLSLGHEISGTVVDVGEKVNNLKIGSRVAARLTASCGQCLTCLKGDRYRCTYGSGIGHGIDGGLQEMITLNEQDLMLIPDSVDLRKACLLACPIGVALKGLRDAVRIVPGERIVVTGAGGGLGVHVAQIAEALGGKVLAVTTSPDKAIRLESFGLDGVFLADELDFSEFVLASTSDIGAEVVVNIVGSDMFHSSLASLSQRGRMLVLGEVTGKPVNISLAELLFRNAVVIGSTGAELEHMSLAMNMIDSGQLEAIVSQTFLLKDTQDAYKLMVEKDTFGRVVVTP